MRCSARESFAERSTRISKRCNITRQFRNKVQRCPEAPCPAGLLLQIPPTFQLLMKMR
uniref:Uncharacterized protein n=1 Tax=Rhizophora mucronata TaxID=61149 RepID=A0A2P2KKT7_RHIMU